MTRAPWVLPKPSRGLPGRQPRGRLHDARLAAGQPGDAVGVDGLARRGQRAAARRSTTSPASGRTRSPPARTTLADQAWNAGFYDDLVVAVPDADLARDESIRPGSSVESLAKLKPSFRKDGTITAGNASPLSDGASAVLLGSEKAASVARPLPGRPDRRPRSARARAAAVRLRAGRGRREGARPGRHRLVRRRRRRAQRGLRRAVAGLRRRLGHRPRDREHPRWRDRHRAPARRVRRPDPRHAREGAARGRPPLGRRGHLHRRRPGARRGAGERRIDDRRTRRTPRPPTRPSPTSPTARPC